MGRSPFDGETLHGRRPHTQPPAGQVRLYGAELAPGAMVGNYVVEQLRSTGGFASVYRGRHRRDGRLAAIKVLHPHLTSSPDVLKRFAKEVETVELLHHPHIVRILDCGETVDCRPYYAMEWLEGRDLHELIQKRGPLPPSEVVALLEPLCSALAAAHRLGIIHRDLKTANVVLVDGDPPTVKLVDFGIAKLVDFEHPEARSELTKTGMRLGTPWSMAPEQILGEPVDSRTDIYALGVMVFQLMTGGFPFQSASPVEVEEMHLTSVPPRMSERAAVPAAYDAVVARCLAKKREGRYPDVNALLADLVAATTRAPTPRQRLGVGLHVELVPSTGAAELDDATLDLMDDLMGSARQACAEAGLALSFASANSMLAARALDDDPAVAREERRRVLQAAHELMQRTASAAAASLTMTVAVHVAPVFTRGAGGSLEIYGGPLLDAVGWTETRPRGRVSASSAAIVELENAVTLERAGDVFTVTGFRT